MNQTVKNVLGIAAVIVVLALGYSAVSYVGSYGKAIQPSSFRSFSVTGDGKATAIPDVAEFSFQIISQGGTDLAGVQQTNTDKTNKAIEFVKSKGVADKDIKTQYYNVDPRYQTYSCRTTPLPIIFNSLQSNQGAPSIAPTPGIAQAPGSIAQVCPPSTIVGYTITQSVDVKIRDFKTIGDIMSGVVTAGANQVGSLNFTLDDPTSAQDQARAQAIMKAKAKAQAIAQAGGFTVGRLLSVQDGGYNPYTNYNSYAPSAMGMGGAVDKAVPAPSIQPGSQDVNVTVTMQYEIE
jgi:uncharacterized protein